MSQEKGVIVGNVVDLHPTTDAESEVITQAIVGTTCNIKSRKQGWCHVQLPDTYTGWVQESAVRLYDGEKRPYASRGRVATVTSLFANINKGPGVESPLLMTVTIGATLEIPDAAVQDRWFHVRLPDGRTGWIQRGDTVTDNAPHLFERKQGRAIIATAKRFLGLPYRWGGTSPFGIDCSGLAQLSYRLNGIAILRDAGLQRGMREFALIPKDAMKPGDLIFFGNPATKDVTHVGIYVGAGKFIHATTNDHPVVQISRLADKHWTERYIDSRHWIGR